MPNEKLVLTKRFINALDSETKRGYLEQFRLKKPIEKNNPLDYDSVMAILNEDGMDKIKEKVVEEWGEIRGMAKGNMEQRVYDLIGMAGLKIKDDKPIEEILLEIKLTHKGVYDELLDNFAVMNRNTLNCYHIKGDLVSNRDRAKAEFWEDANHYLKENGKGEHLDIHWYDYKNELIGIILHAGYMKYEEFWKDKKKRKQMAVRHVRTAVLEYIFDEGIIWIGARAKRDKLHFFGSFSQSFLGIEIDEDNDAIYSEYSLEALQNGRFNYDGAGDIVGVQLREIEFISSDDGEEVRIRIRGKDTLKALKARGLKGRFMRGKAIGAKFRFLVREGNSTGNVTFLVQPPFTTDLFNKKHAELIDAYLKKNGVKLN